MVHTLDAHASARFGPWGVILFTPLIFYASALWLRGFRAEFDCEVFTEHINIYEYDRSTTYTKNTYMIKGTTASGQSTSADELAL